MARPHVQSAKRLTMPHHENTTNERCSDKQNGKFDKISAWNLTKVRLVTTENTDKLTYQLDQKTVEELKATETKAPEYIGAAAGKYQWDDRSGGDADKVRGEAISKYSWSNGKKMIKRCNKRQRQTFCNMGNVYVFNIASICIHGEELLRQLAFHQKYRRSHNETNVRHI